MQADTRGLKEAEKYLKANPATTYAAFLAAGRELAEKLYKKEETRERFTKCWAYEAKFYVFCANRQLAARIAYDLNAINQYQSEKKRDEEMHGRWLSAERDHKLWALAEVAWSDLQEIGLPTDAYYSDDNNNLHVREIVIVEAEASSAPEVAANDQNASQPEAIASSANASRPGAKVMKAIELAKKVNAKIAVNGAGKHKFCYTGKYDADTTICVYDNNATLQATKKGDDWHDCYQHYHLLTNDGSIRLFVTLAALILWLERAAEAAKPASAPAPADDQGAALIAGLLASDETHYSIVPDRFVHNWRIRTMNIKAALLSWLDRDGPDSLTPFRSPEEARTFARKTYPSGLELTPEAFKRVWYEAYNEILTPDHLMMERYEAPGDLDDSPLVTGPEVNAKDGLIY